MDGRVPKLSQVSRLLGSKPRTYMGQSPILAAVDLSPVQPQSSSQQDLSQDYRPASVSSRLLSFIQRLGTHFAMKDLGDLHFFLGIEAKRTSTALVLTQTKYTLDLLTRTHMQDSKPCPTPGSKLSAYDGAPLSDATEYRSIVVALQYLTLTRPDICYAVNQVCQFMHALTTVHPQAVKRILRYLKGSLGLGLTITPGPLTTFFAFSDADWAGCPDSRRSTTGFCVFLGKNLLTRVSKK